MVANENNPYEDRIVLSEIHSGGRTIAYSTAGDPNGAPALFFYPVGANRRMLVSLHDAAASASVRLICANRPGMGGTSPAEGRGGPAGHAAAACADAVAVLDALGVDRAGLLFMCAGAPFALSLASRYPDRLSGKLLGIAACVLPADCADTKGLYRFGALYCPNWLSRSVGGTVMSSIISSFSSLPQSMLVSSITKQFSTEERDVFEAEFDETEFLQRSAWTWEEKGSRVADISVLMSKGTDVGINYGQIEGDAAFFHGDNDKVVLFDGAEWLAQQIESAKFTRLPQGSHEGAMFLLHPAVRDALRHLG